MAERSAEFFGLRVSAFLAVVAPMLLAFNMPPSATFLNQALALIGWAAFLGMIVLCASTLQRPGAGATSLIAALGLLAIAPVVSALAFGLPWPLALSSLALIAVAMLVVITAVCIPAADGELAFGAMSAALVAAGVLSAVVALVQVFVPHWTDGTWLAHPTGGGRVGANLRQPNHLSSLLVLSALGLVWMHESAAALRPRHRGPIAAVLLLLVFGIVLTASRTGAICVALLAVWGVVDRRLSRPARIALVALPVFFVLMWIGMDVWSRTGAAAFGGDAQLHRSDLSSSRYAIWANTLSLIAAHPWLGVGWGEFNFAWTLTPFPGRPVAFFDHTHNLPLQLLVELGVPIGLLVLGLLAWALWRAVEAAAVGAGRGSATARCACVMVATMGVHSQLEYPLWYAYFLLPTAFAFGCALGFERPAGALRPRMAGRLPKFLGTAAVVLMVGTVVSLVDYRRVVVIFAPTENSPSLSERIADGRKSWFFAHHADYAAATTVEHPSEALSAFERAPHYLLDARLMQAWARALDEAGEAERARYVAARLKEFHNDQAADFFAPCDAPPPAGGVRPFQCIDPPAGLGYRNFR